MPRKDKNDAREWQRQYDATHKEQKRAHGLRTADVAKERWRRGYHKNIVRSMLQAARARAKQKGLAFTITEINIFLPELCPLLLIPLAASKEGRMPGSPSLDRKDSTKGYVPGNVWVISYRANRIKNDATLAEFVLMANNMKFLLSI